MEMPNKSNYFVSGVHPRLVPGKDTSKVGVNSIDKGNPSIEAFNIFYFDLNPILVQGMNSK